ncbi:hypothetical protein [Acinetobacter courvalinii]|uniref:hypothetical protein n=1 Tax=Acinetobacter courvalinii TaxID=280147 RepID=UPI001D0E5CA6|nr:hypothetical protein [Acinetobacter courvalinii]
MGELELTNENFDLVPHRNNIVKITEDSPHYKNYRLIVKAFKKIKQLESILSIDDSTDTDYIYAIESVKSNLTELYSYFNDNNNEDILIKINDQRVNFEFNNILKKIDSLPKALNSDLILGLESVEGYLEELLNQIYAYFDMKEFRGSISEGYDKLSSLDDSVSKANILLDDLRNKTIKDLYDEDYYRFNKISNIYEYLFYSLIIVMFLYFFGFNIYISDIDFGGFSIGFSDKKHVADISFYIQKISVLILSTTLAAFLLKRSFMNRRLADESYRTSKELSGFPRYIEPLPEEMQNKIRFDLAYKYFGNSIHHESYTGGENLMHENMKANTEFLKSVKDLSSGKENKAKSESDQ